jgi:hypothetical protein
MSDQPRLAAYRSLAAEFRDAIRNGGYPLQRKVDVEAASCLLPPPWVP